MTDTITHERLLALLTYDPQSGKFHHAKMRPGVKRPNKMAGCLNKAIGYVVIRLDGRLYYAHRLAWLFVHGAWPADEVDHVNGVKTDNRICNLRAVDRQTNQQNLREVSTANTSGYLGVRFCNQKGLFKASICANGKDMHLGYFATAPEAHASYLTAKRLLHKGCSI